MVLVMVELVESLTRLIHVRRRHVTGSSGTLPTVVPSSKGETPVTVTGMSRMILESNDDHKYDIECVVSHNVILSVIL